MQDKFLKNFSTFGQCAIYDGANSYFVREADKSLAPIRVWQRYQEYLENSTLVDGLVPIYAIDPRFKGNSCLAWFDVDSHGVVDPIESKAKADAIYEALKSLGLHPEYAQSSSVGNYHIYLCFNTPQSVSWISDFQTSLLAQLNIECEIGPMGGKKIRYWYFQKSSTAKPVLFDEGAVDADLSTDGIKELIWAFRVRNKKRAAYKAKKSKFNVENYVPKGGNSNEMLLKMVAAARKAGMNDNQILDQSIAMHKLGKVKENLQEYMVHCQRVIDKCILKRPPKISAFWDTVERGLDDETLFRLCEEWTEQALNTKNLVVPSRTYAEYLQVSQPAAYKRIKKLSFLRCIDKGIRGESGRAAVYKIGGC